MNTKPIPMPTREEFEGIQAMCWLCRQQGIDLTPNAAWLMWRETFTLGDRVSTLLKYMLIGPNYRN